MWQKTINFVKIKFQALKQATISTPFITLVVLDYGAIIQKILVKDVNGGALNVVIGHNQPSHYLGDDMSLGACIGRYAGCISKGGFELDREKHWLYQQDGIHLNGGKEGFGKKYWTFEEVQYGDEPFIRLSYTSKHLEEGYPGNLKVTVTYKLQHNKLHIIHHATTDRTTVVNLTNHSYFKLDKSPSMEDHSLVMNATQMVVTDKQHLPTGALASTKDTANDFRTTRPLGNLHLDASFIVEAGEKMAAKLASRLSGITMEVGTNQPAMVVYTPANLSAICLEPQNFPDAPNFSHFPSSVLKPGEAYENRTHFTFDIQ